LGFIRRYGAIQPKVYASGVDWIAVSLPAAPRSGMHQDGRCFGRKLQEGKCVISIRCAKDKKTFANLAVVCSNTQLPKTLQQ
jgi:hypothetical protein